MGFAALGGPCRAPGHTLTPEVLQPKQLLHLLPSDLYAGLSHYQACEKRQKGWKGRVRKRRHVIREDKDGNKKYGKEGKRESVFILEHIKSEHG